MTRAPFPNSPYAGSSFKTALDGKFKQIYDAAAFPLTSVGGTANAVTATLDPALDGDGLLDGMSFYITWGAANTSDVTLAINGGTPVPVLGFDGLALPVGAVGSGLRSMLTYWDGDLILVSPSLLMGGAGVGLSYRWVFETSGTLTKPAGLDDARMVFVESWGAGGGGAANVGGGGGGYNLLTLSGADLPSSVTVTIGAGGVVGVAGGNTTFGALLTAYGGGGGAAGIGGGGGGGELEAGGVGAAGGRIGGGPGGGSVQPGLNAMSVYGGGGGTGTITAGTGGWAVYGGGGGAGGSGTGGASVHAGSGGAPGVAGQAPAGGGGSSATGARGEIRVWIP